MCCCGCGLILAAELASATQSPERSADSPIAQDQSQTAAERGKLGFASRLMRRMAQLAGWLPAAA